jgi:hypothetical protein
MTAVDYPSIVSMQIPGTLSASSAVSLVMPFAGRISGGHAAVTTAPVGGPLTFDVKKGSTVMGSFSVADGASTDEIALSATEANVKFAAGQVLTLDVAAVPSEEGDVAGANLMVTLVVDQANLDGDGTNEYSLLFRRGNHDGGRLINTAGTLTQDYQENEVLTTGASAPNP